MQTVRTSLLVAGLSASLPAIGWAASIDFESTAQGAYGSPIVFSSAGAPDATLSVESGSTYITEAYFDSSGVDGNVLSSHDPDGVVNLSKFRIDFSSAINTFSIAFDDDCFLNCDQDTGHLQAFDSGGNIIHDLTTELLEGALDPDYGMLSFAGGAISYVMFWSDSNVEDGENSVYWDNISYEVSEVPLPGTLGLLGVGLAGLGLLRRKSA